MADKKKSKKPSSTVLGANLRSWRKAYNLSIDDVAEALRISRSTVGHYETGRSEVPDKILYKYSDYLGVSIEQLMNGKPAQSKVKVDSSLFLKNIDVFLPIEECEPENEYAARACKLHREMYDPIKRGDESALYRIEECLDDYEKALEEDEVEDVVAANFLALFFFCALSTVPAVELMEQEKKPAILEKLVLKDERIEKLFYEPSTEVRQDFQEAAQAFRDPDVKEMVIEIIRQLKQTGEWYELADYYIAFQYIFGLVDNGLNPKLNLLIGSEMLDAIADVGNRYAKKVNKVLIEQFTHGSLHSVDDK